jgi:hypothetical protein
MRKNIFTLLVVCAAMVSFVLGGCGSTGSQSTPAASKASKSTVFGVASLDMTANGTVSVKDSSVPAQEKTAAIRSNGTYTVDVSGLKSPFLLKAVWTGQEGDKRMYSASTKGGRTNINPLSDTAIAASADGGDRDELYSRQGRDDDNRTADKFEHVINSLRTVLAPLFELYGISGNAVSGDDDGEDDGEDDNTGLRAMFHDVRFVVKNGWVTVTNRQTGGVIFTGSLTDLASGTFYPENMPAGPETGGGGTTTPLPAACIYTYSSWGACQADGTQTRNLLSTSPAGCTGTPVLSQPCTYVPPTPTACTYTYGPWGACLSSGTQIRSLLSSSPAGCTGTPVLTQSCTYVPPAPTTCTSFTYSPWGTCQSNNTQTRSLLTSSPAGCTGGTPVLTQPCTYVPPTPACGSCHAIPPATGQHTFHVSSVGLSCSTCHGTGYSSTTVNTATHQNGVKDVVSSLNFNATTRSCSPGCHGTRTW